MEPGQLSPAVSATGPFYVPNIAEAVLTELGLKFTGPGLMGTAFNVEITMDLTEQMKYRTGNLHYVIFDKPHPWSSTVCLRMVKPWTEWIMIMTGRPGADASVERRSEEESIELARAVAGIRDIPVKVHGVSRWHVAGESAESYTDGRVICLGDAVHRHPPLVGLALFDENIHVIADSMRSQNGLGSNTCIQDAFNLGWKLAYVLKGSSRACFASLKQSLILLSRESKRTIAQDI